MPNLKTHLFIPNLLIVLLLLSGIIYIVILQYSVYINEVNKEKNRYLSYLNNEFTWLIKQNQHITELVSNDDNFINALTLYDQEALIESLTPYFKSSDINLLNIYDNQGEVLVRADRPHTFGYTDSIGLWLAQHSIDMPEGIAVRQFKNKIALFSWKKIEQMGLVSGILTTVNYIDKKYLEYFSKQLNIGLSVKYKDYIAFLPVIKTQIQTYQSQTEIKLPAFSPVLFSQHLSFFILNKKEHLTNSLLPHLFFIASIAVIISIIVLFVFYHMLNKVVHNFRQNQQHFNEITENIEEVFWIVSPEWDKVIYINTAYEQLWGYSCQQVYQDHTLWFKTIYDQDYKRFENYVSQLKNTPFSYVKKQEKQEFRFIHQSGDIFWVLLHSRLILDSQKNIKYIVNVAIDITRYKEEELAHLTSEKRYRAIIEDQTEVILRCTLTYQLTFVNKAYCRLFNHSYEYLIGQTFFDIIPPQDHQQVKNYLKKLSIKKPYITYEQRILGEDNHAYWYQWVGRAIFDSNKKITEYQIVGQDISQRKKAEFALQKSTSTLTALFKSSPMAIIILDLDLRVKMWNPAAESIFGWKKEEVLGQKPKIIPNTEQKKFQEILNRLRKGDNISELETIRQHKKGHLIDVSVSTAALFDEYGYVSSFMAMFTDISVRKQAQQELKQEKLHLAQRVEERTLELQQVNQKLAQSSKLKDEFLANISHELRTPLNSILGVSEALLEGVYGKLIEKQPQFISQIYQSGEHLLALINDVLDVSKIEAGKLSLQRSETDIIILCQENIEIVKNIAYKKKINILSDFNITKTHLFIDHKRVKQILLNLLTNAIKFTPEQGSVGLSVTEDTVKEMTLFAVWDTGIGIEEDKINFIFDAFTQIDSSLSRQHEGSGLGLTLVKQLLDLHDGKLTIDTAYKKGSCFTVHLPWNSMKNLHSI